MTRTLANVGHAIRLVLGVLVLTSLLIGAGLYRLAGLVVVLAPVVEFLRVRYLAGDDTEGG